MNIVFISSKRGHLGALTLRPARIVAAALLVFTAVPAASLYAGYRLGSQPAVAVTPEIEIEMSRQRAVVAEAHRSAEENLNALAIRLGQMQAHVIRLDALGQRLTHAARLDDGEFDFTKAPALGGPESEGSPMGVTDFVAQLKGLEVQLNDRERQFGVLEALMMNRKVQAEVLPSGNPVASGWVSSYFGTRSDPINGHRAFHAGVDFAGDEGDDVLAVASGIVSFSGEKNGYGNVVEVTHGNGYITRYGHNSRNLVEVGDTVKKGHAIALLGSTGRSTGPHVHFEVLQDGKQVDPERYLAENSLSSSR